MESPRDVPRLKICCIGSLAEARRALDLGAEALGFVSAMPSGPGVIPESRIAEIVSALAGGTDPAAGAAAAPEPRSILLSSLSEPGAIVAQVRRCRCAGIQLCDRLKPKDYPRLRAELPDRLLIAVLHVTGEGCLDEARALSFHAHALLLDSGRRGGSLLELGGTGRPHDWSLSRRIRELASCPVILAGGLDAGNVAEAVGTVRPHGVDVCTGVRTEGRLDPAKLAAFARAAREALD